MDRVKGRNAVLNLFFSLGFYRIEKQKNTNERKDPGHMIYRLMSSSQRRSKAARTVFGDRGALYTEANVSNFPFVFIWFKTLQRLPADIVFCFEKPARPGSHYSIICEIIAPIDDLRRFATFYVRADLEVVYRESRRKQSYNFLFLTEGF